MKLTPIQRFWKLLSPYQKQINKIHFYAVLNGIVNLSLPLGIQAIILFIQSGEISTSWMLLVGFVLIGIAATGFFQIQQLRIVEDIQQDIFARSAFEFAFRLPKIKLPDLDKIHAPELVNRFFDTLTIQKGLPKILIDFSLAAFQIIFGLLLLTIYSPYFILLAIFLLLLIWVVVRITGPKGIETSLKESKQKYKIAHWLEEIARTHKSFKMNPETSFHLRKTDSIAVDYIKTRRQHFKVLILQFIHFIGFKITLAAGLLILGSILVIGEQMNIGQFVASEIVIILIINSVEKVIRIVETIYDVLTALEKIGFVTDLQLDETNRIVQPDTNKGMGIEILKLDFSYPNSRRKVFDKLFLKIQSEDRVSITGQSGSGKSTLFHIIGGLYSNYDGQILLNNIPIENYNKEKLYKSIGLNLSSNQLFQGTIKENIFIGRDISMEELFRITDVIGLQSFIAQQPYGVDTPIDPEGRRLPREAVQKILLARTIICKPQLLLLEDPLTFVEDSEKRRIIDYITHPDHKWTLIVIADYPYWQEKCNTIVDLSKEE